MPPAAHIANTHGVDRADRVGRMGRMARRWSCLHTDYYFGGYGGGVYCAFKSKIATGKRFSFLIGLVIILHISFSLSVSDLRWGLWLTTIRPMSIRLHTFLDVALSGRLCCCWPPCPGWPTPCWSSMFVFQGSGNCHVSLRPDQLRRWAEMLIDTSRYKFMPQRH